MLNNYSVRNFHETLSFFDKHGSTDFDYLKNHYRRFTYTIDFCDHIFIEKKKQTLNVLDLGCHWLHQAYFFRQIGCNVTAGDSPNTLQLPSVQNIALDLNINLIKYTRLDLGEGIRNLPSDSFDIINMGEIIEHLAFNPLVMWKEIYRILKSGGHIILSTPNSMYYKSLFLRFNNLVNFGQYGISVSEIFDYGTYGHHWKEFSILELFNYFKILSADFHINKYIVETISSDFESEKKEALALVMEDGFNYFNFSNIVLNLESINLYPFGDQIFMDISLPNKHLGIQSNPPWYVE
jgi:2-polyprenyl-3-methyl-5-hydroxy-6-metoxy-1,4-benzoquinol methylase